MYAYVSPTGTEGESIGCIWEDSVKVGVTNCIYTDYKTRVEYGWEWDKHAKNVTSMINFKMFKSCSTLFIPKKDACALRPCANFP